MANFGRGLLAGYQVGEQSRMRREGKKRQDELDERDRKAYERTEADRKLLEEARMQSGETPAAAGAVDEGQIPMSVAGLSAGPARRGVEVTPADMPMAAPGSWREGSGASLNEVPPMAARESAQADGAPAPARPALGVESNVGPGRAGTIPAEPSAMTQPQPAGPAPVAPTTRTPDFNPQADGGMPRARTFDDLDAMNRNYQAQVQYLMGKGRPDLALPIMVQGAKIREQARGAAFARARQQAEMTGDVNAYVPFINNYVQAGFQLKNIRQAGEGYVLDGVGPDGKDFSKPVAAADMQRYLKFIADPAAQRALEARMAEEAHKAALEIRKEREKNRMQKVGQGETLVDTVGGGSFTAPSSVKATTREDEYGNKVPVLYNDEGFLSGASMGAAGPAGGQGIPKAVATMQKEVGAHVFKLNGVNDFNALDPSNQARVSQQQTVAANLIAANHGTDNWAGLSPAVAADIAYKMSTGDLKPVQFNPRDGGPPVPGVVYEGRKYLLDPYGAQRFRGGAGAQPGMPREPGAATGQPAPGAAAANPAQLANVARSFGLDDKTTSLALSIFEQESGSGRANTGKANYAGARGPMQVTKDTFEGLKREGLIPSDWEHGNPAHTTAAGIALIKQLHQQYAGDPRKIAAAYYSGPKAIAADGTIKNLRDPKNPKAPSTLEYVRQVTSRMASAPSGIGTREVTGTIAQG